MLIIGNSHVTDVTDISHLASQWICFSRLQSPVLAETYTTVSALFLVAGYGHHYLGCCCGGGNVSTARSQRSSDSSEIHAEMQCAY